MTVDITQRRSFEAQRGHTYSYFYTSATSQKRTFLFILGFPSHIYDWKYQIEHFTSLGYGVLVPDLIGFGASSKPDSASDYRPRVMSDDLRQLLRHLKLDRVIGVGHDIGATVLSRFASYYPDIWDGLVCLTVGASKMGSPFNLDMINKMTKDAMGFEMLGYMKWFTTDPDAQETLEKHAEAAMNVMFAADQAVWAEWFHPLGKMKQFVSEDKRVPVGDWYQHDFKREHLAAFGKPDGYKGSIRWYRMFVENLFAPDEKDYEDYKVKTPTLLVLPKKPESAAQMQKGMISEWTTDLHVVELDTGHWIHLEKAAETNKVIQEFVEGLSS